VFTSQNRNKKAETLHISLSRLISNLRKKKNKNRTQLTKALIKKQIFKKQQTKSSNVKTNNPSISLTKWETNN